MKRHTLLVASLCMAMVASAQNVMRIHNTDGTVTTLPVSQVDYVDFDFDASFAESLGGRANCFIVDHYGAYTFSATHVDGTPVVGIDHVSWLWREKADAPIVEDEVDYDATTNTVAFTAGAAEGNAVLAAVGSDGKIIWVWHIWSTDRPKDCNMGESTRIMDRHLGAVSTDPSDGRDTWGLVYQYGRNVPFYFIGDNQEFDTKEAMDQANKFTEINPEFSGMKWNVSSAQRTEGYTIAESMANPMTHMMHKYVANSNGGYHWASEAHLFEYVWGSRSMRTKTNYDPCPPGYRVPFSEDLVFEGMSYEPNTSLDMKYPISGFMLDGNWWPMNTGRHYEDGCALYGSSAVSYCDRLFLWTAFADEFYANPLTTYSYCPIRVIVENNYKNGQLVVSNPAPSAGAFGHAVRCVRESAPVATPPMQPIAGNAQLDANTLGVNLTYADGKVETLHQTLTKAPLTILFFNNPDCTACRTMNTAMSSSPALASHLADGSLNVVSVYTDEAPADYLSRRADYPKTWDVTYDASQRILTEGLFDVSRTPSLYLIDSEGNILLSDTDLTAIEALIH